MSESEDEYLSYTDRESNAVKLLNKLIGKQNISKSNPIQLHTLINRILKLESELEATKARLEEAKKGD
jgi:hypothetical protein